MAHTCSPSTLGGRGRKISELEASQVYRVSSRKARAIQRNPVLKKPNPKTQKTKQNKTPPTKKHNLESIIYRDPYSKPQPMKKNCGY